MARKRNYINNRDFYESLCDYLNKCSEAEEQGKQLPRVPEYIGKAFMLLAQRLGTKGNFSGYSYLEEMKSDAVINCVAQIRSFNPQKSNNPFAYFTQVIKNAFIRRIKSEKVQHYIKIKNLDNLSVNDEIAGIATQQNLHNEISDNYVRDFEAKNNVKKPKNKKTKVLIAFETEDRFVSYGKSVEIDETTDINEYNESVARARRELAGNTQ